MRHIKKSNVLLEEAWLVPSGDLSPDHTLVGSTLQRCQAWNHSRLEHKGAMPPTVMTGGTRIYGRAAAEDMRSWTKRQNLSYEEASEVLFDLDAFDSYGDVKGFFRGIRVKTGALPSQIGKVVVFTDKKHFKRFIRPIRACGFRGEICRADVPDRELSLMGNMAELAFLILSWVEPRGWNPLSAYVRWGRKKSRKPVPQIP